MKQLLITGLSLLVLAAPALAQTGAPQGFHYQAVPRQSDGTLFPPGTTLRVRFQIRENTANGAVRYAEFQTLDVNQQGAVGAVVGAGEALVGQPHEMNAITWNTAPYFLALAVDVNDDGVFEAGEDFGAMQLVSVPYALYAAESGSSLPGPEGPPGPKGDKGDKGDPGSYLAGQGIQIQGNVIHNIGDGDDSPANELQTLSLNGHQLSLSDGNSVILPDGIDGSGTAGRVPVFVQGTELGNSEIRETADGHVGINGAAPHSQYGLAVNEGAIFNGPLYTSGNFETSKDVIVGDDLAFVNGAYLTIYGAHISSSASLVPFADNFCTLGLPTVRWQTVYATNGAIQTSDARLKRDIQPLAYGVNDLMKLRPVSYSWKDGSDGERPHLGFLAQELQTVLPEVVHDREWVAGEKDGNPGQWKPAERLGVAYSEIIPVAVAAIQEQQRTLEQQGQKLDALQAELKTLKTENARLKNGESAPEAEKEAIRRVIARETEAYYRQDFEAWKNNFVQTDYFRQHGYWEGFPEKVQFYNGFDTLQQVKARQFNENRTYWKGSYEKRYNENFRVYPDVAWYTFEQDSYDGSTHKFLGKSVELRILEKHEGQWKIVYLGFQYLPLPGKE